jgi:hypothetical protein
MGYLSATLVKLLVGSPIVRFLIKREDMRRPISRRWGLHVACFITFALLSHPFVNKPPNYFDRFNAIVSADPSTVYQQYMRSQVWLDTQLAQGRMEKEEVDARKSENEKIHKRIHSAGNKLLYVKFGDVIDYAEGSIDEPSFLYVAGLSVNFVAWFMGAVLLVCHYLPPGGFMTIVILLVTLFAIEMEARFVNTDSLFGYMLFINESEWTVFEAVNACKEAMVGVVCGVIVLAGMFSGSGDQTKTLLRNLLRTNAGVVNVLKDEQIKEVTMDPDDPVSPAGTNLPHLIARSVGVFVLFSSVFLKSSD